MSNNEILEKNYELIKLCVSHQMRKYETPPELYDDIVQDMCMIVLEYPNDKLNKIEEENHFNAWMTGILVHQLYSTNSQSYRIYRRLNDNSYDISNAYTLDNEYEPKVKPKPKQKQEEQPISIEEYNINQEDSDFMLSVKESLDKLSIGELSIFLGFVETGNISKLARQLKVPQALLSHYIGNIKDKLKQNISEREYD